MSYPVVGVPLWLHLLACFCGGLVGVTELLSRYRDEPFRTLGRRLGVVYILVNAATSGVVSLMLAHWKDALFPGVDPLARALLSGFAAMAVLRSKFFTYRTKANEEVSVGFDAVVRIMLTSLDRGVDRAQSSERWQVTYERLSDVADDDMLRRLILRLRINLGSYQSVTQDEVAEFTAASNSLLKADVPPIPVGLRAVAAGLAFQAIAGNSNFNAIADGFRKEEGLPAVAVQTLFGWWPF